MIARYFDAHCHVQFEQYDKDRESVIEAMREHGIAGIVVGCDLESSRKAVELAERHDHLFASVGLHPNHAALERFDLSAYRALAGSAKVVAIGECGLDYYRTTGAALDDAKKEQERLFREHVALAAELGLPLIIHARPSKGTMDAYHDVIAILKEAKAQHPRLSGDIHFFVGGVPEAEAFLALGFTVSFTAVVTFAREYDESIRAVPLSSILSETDAPYVAPQSRRGARNDSLAIPEVVAKIATIRGEDPETVRAILLANARRVFSVPDTEAAEALAEAGISC